MLYFRLTIPKIIILAMLAFLSALKTHNIGMFYYN